MLRLKSLLIMAALICLFFILPSSGFSENVMTLQIHPYLPSSELLRKFSPLITYLENKLETEIVCNISKDYQEHIEMIGNDKVDIAYLGPASYVKVVDTFGSKPLLARLEIKGSPLFQGVIITLKSSSIRSVNDLKGKRFAFGDPDSTMSHIVPLTVLHDKGINLNDLAKHSFLNGHRNVALGVLMGDFDAGAVKEEVFYEYKDRGLFDLEWTPKISEHLFVAKSTLPDKVVNKLRAALLSLRDDPDANRIMSSIKQDVTALVPVEDKNYDNLRVILKKAENINTVK
jgi:phosphonate transport system substrate-binding protein